MNLRILNKINFVQKFLVPISRINDLSTLTLENNQIYNLNRTPDNNFSLYITSSEVEYSGEKRTISFSDIKKFIKVFDCIQSDTIDLLLTDNTVEYKSNGTKFKFHLINDNIVKSPNFSIDKIKTLEFDLSFKLSLSTINLLIKSSTFITDSNKLYISTNDGKVYGEMTDKTKMIIDSYATEISPAYEGSGMDKPLAFDFDLFRNISFLRVPDFIVKMNTKIGVIVFDIDDDNYKMRYISTAKVS
jgi:hypothetical protein